MNRIAQFAALAALALSTGCGGPLGMVPDPEPLYVPSPSKARVVFVRHSGLGGAINFAVVDHDVQFLGSVKGNNHFAVPLPPGEYAFYVIAENTEANHATTSVIS